MQRRLHGLETVMFVLLAVVGMVAPHSYSRVLWALPAPQARLYADFRGILLFLMDGPLLVLLVLTVGYVAVSAGFRQERWQVARAVVMRGGAIFWVALLLWMGLTALWAPHPGLSVYVALRYGAGMVVALLIAFAVREERESVVLWGLLIGAVFQALYALAQTLNGGALGFTYLGEIVWLENNLFNMAERDFRAYGLAVHPNNLSGYLLVALFAAVYMLRLRWHTRRGMFAMIAYVIATGLFLTFSRLAVVAAALVMVPLLLLFIDVRWRPPRSWVTWVVVAVLFGGVGLLGYRLADVVIFRFVNVFIYRDPLPARVTLGFADAANVVLNHWRFGAGNGNLMVLAGADASLPGRLLLPPHNVYVIVLAELGLPGLILFLSGVTVTVYGVVRYRRYPLANLWGFCLLAMLAIMVFDYYFWLDYRSNMLLWWVLGLYWGNASLAGEAQS